MAISQKDDSVVRKPRGRRKSYLVNRAFQWKYTALVVVAVFIVATFMSYMLFGVLHQQARARVINPAVVSVWENAVVIGVAGLAFSIALAIAFGLWTILITHRICGPMFVIEGYIEELKQGRFPKPRALRKKDEFKAFHDAFVQAIGTMKAARQFDFEQLTDALHAARSGAAGSDQDRRQAIELLRAQLATMCRDAARSLGQEDTDVSAGTPAKAGFGNEQRKELAGVGS